MKSSIDINLFCREMDQRLAGLMAAFREIHQANPENGGGPSLRSFFRELFSLQTYFQESAPRLEGAGTARAAGRETHYEWLYKSGLILNASLDTRALLELALDTVLEMCACARGFIATVTEAGEYEWIAARNFHRETISEPEREISGSVIQRALQWKTEVQVDANDPNNSLLQATSMMRREGGALVCVPIWIEQKVHGVIYLDQFSGDITVSLFQLVKQFSLQLASFMKNARAFSELRASRETLLDNLKNRYRFDRIVAQSKPMLAILKTVAKVAATDARVLIQGETGTGKDLIARALHENSSRRDGPYVEVDCGALPPNLIESELFGYKKGAFTGAQEDKLGLLEAAQGGTLFLDEINNLPREFQTKLLRALQQSKVRRIGETRERVVDFRLVCATSKDLKAELGDEGFRQDLYYRINTLTLDLPPLRQRIDDLLPLVTSFLEKFCRLYQRSELVPSPEVMTALECHAWPGNVRELEHVIERAVILSEGPRLTLADLPFEFHGTDPWEAEHEPPTLEDFVNRSKKHYIAKVLRECGGKKVEAAKRLGINRSYLFQLIKQLGIEE